LVSKCSFPYELLRRLRVAEPSAFRGQWWPRLLACHEPDGRTVGDKRPTRLAVVHIPHASLVVPSEVAVGLLLAREKLRHELFAAETPIRSRRKGGGRGLEAAPVMQAAEQGYRGELTGCGCGSRGEPARARGRLVAEGAVGAAVVVAEVLTQDAVGLALAEDQDVVQAVATKRANQALADSVRQRL
jgi:hypothetical protein